MEDARERLYHNEIAHAQGYVPPIVQILYCTKGQLNRIIALEETYYNDSCISSMPEKVRKLDEPHMSTSTSLLIS